MIAHRYHYLASDQDAWTTSGLVDPTGAAGSSIGQLSEIRVRHDILPGNLRLEAGIAHLTAGSFLDDVPGGDGEDSTLFYFQTMLTL